MDTRFPGGMLAQKSAIFLTNSGSNIDLVPGGIPMINAGGVQRWVPIRCDVSVTPVSSEYLPSAGYGTFATMGAAVIQIWTATGGTGTRLDTGTNTLSNLNSTTGYQNVGLATLTAYPQANNLFIYLKTAPANVGYMDFYLAGNEYTNY